MTRTLAFLFPQGAPGWHRRALWLYLFVATASHGCLDALTDGGLGVAFFSPFSNARYFFPVRPIRVSPIGIGAFVAGDLLAVLTSEIRCVWLPSALFMAVAWLRASVRGEGDAGRASESRGRWR